MQDYVDPQPLSSTDIRASAAESSLESKVHPRLLEDVLQMYTRRRRFLLLFLGPPGSGKTEPERAGGGWLETAFGFYHLSGGDAYRAAQSRSSTAAVCAPSRPVAAVVIPVLLARPEGTNLDTQVYRAHVQNSRRYLGTSGTFSFNDTAEGRQLQCKDGSGVGTPKVDLKSSWQDLIDVLAEAPPRTQAVSLSTDGAGGAENARRVPLASTGAVEAVLSAAAVAPPRALSSASSGWNTPLPQSSAEDAVHLVGAEVESLATTDCLEQALIKPKRLKKLQPGLAIAKTRARFQRLAKLASALESLYRSEGRLQTVAKVMAALRWALHLLGDAPVCFDGVLAKDRDSIGIQSRAWELPDFEEKVGTPCLIIKLTCPEEDKVVDAVRATNSPRVTAADVAAAGGLSLSDAKSGVVSLAAALGGETELEVSKSGDIVYKFPSDVRAALSKASAAAAAREAWLKAKPAVFTVLRAAFGVALFASIAVIYSAIIAISTSSNRDRDDRRGNDSFGGGGFGGPGFGGLYYGPSPFDIFYYRPYYTYGYENDWDRRREPPKMGFLESVYSFVFGREEKQLAAVAAAARRNGGVLTAEQMAPLLDPPEYKSEESSYNVNESWVLPAISKLNGRPEVAQNGQIVYVFDDLQTTAGSSSRDGKPPAILEEQEVPFSRADDGNLFLVGLLGVANLVGAAYLGAQFAGLGTLKLVGFLATVKTWYPALLTYAIAAGTAGPHLPAPDLSGQRRTSTASSRSQWATLDLNCERQSLVGNAGPQPRAPVLSGQRRASTASSRSQWATPDLNSELQIPVGTAGPQPRAPDASGQCPTSTAR
eukprot:s247_g35.t1